MKKLLIAVGASGCLLAPGVAGAAPPDEVGEFGRHVAQCTGNVGSTVSTIRECTTAPRAGTASRVDPDRTCRRSASRCSVRSVVCA